MKLLLLLPLIALTCCAAETSRTGSPERTPQPVSANVRPSDTPPLSATETVNPSGPPPQPNCPDFNAEFLVTQNWLHSPKFRYIQVYLEPAAFSEKNLRKLFACISKENPEPKNLRLTLETDRSRVQIPTGRPGTGMSNMPPDPNQNDFLRAIYSRNSGRATAYDAREFFRYSPRTHVDEFYFITVILEK